MKLFEISTSPHRKQLSVEEALESIKEHCSDAFKNFDTPLWRGFSGKNDAYFIQGDLGQRKSANTSNYYTIIMDEFLPKLGYPKRSKSIILANNSNKWTAGGYGTEYAIFPYNGVKIGVCESDDFWETSPIKIGDSLPIRVKQWNNYFFITWVFC